MKAQRFREMSLNDLSDEAIALSEQLFKLRVQKATGQLENILKIRNVRKDLARVKTIITEKESEAEAQAG